MDEGPVEAVVQAVELEVEAQCIADEGQDGIVGVCWGSGSVRQPLQVRRRQLGALGDVQPEGGRVAAPRPRLPSP